MNRVEMIEIIKKKHINALKIQKWYRLKKFSQELYESRQKLIKLTNNCLQNKTNQINMFDPDDSQNKNKKYELLLDLISNRDYKINFHKILVRYYRYTNMFGIYGANLSLKYPINISHIMDMISRNIISKNILPHCLPIDSPIFLTSWLIVSSPEKILGKKTNDILKGSDDLYDIIYFTSKELIKIIKTAFIPEDGNKQNLSNDEKYINFKKIFLSKNYQKKFMNIFCKYSDQINEWLIIDKSSKINELLYTYFSVCDNIDELKNDDLKSGILQRFDSEQKEELLKEYENSLNNTFEILKNYDDLITKEYLDKYYKMTKIASLQLEYEQMNILTQDIKNKTCLALPIVIEEIKNSFLKLNAHKIKSDNYHSFDELFDIEMIIHLIKNSAFRKDNIEYFGNNLKFLINSLESPTQNTITNNQWDMIIDNTYNDNAEYFANILFFILNRQKEIFKDLDSLDAILHIKL